jgi:glycosyltransferase involved in cell wall biosynthesis
MASGYPIRLHPDCPRAELEALYQRAAIYWHAAGYGADPDTEPEALEHFGMSTAEATARGAVPVVFAGGGQLEVVDDGRTGYTWNTLEQLQNHTRRLAAQPDERRRVAAAAVAASTRFTRARFRAEVLAQVEPLVREASASLE